jgi:predicted phage terminase large subunit-like protein
VPNERAGHAEGFKSEPPASAGGNEAAAQPNETKTIEVSNERAALAEGSKSEPPASAGGNEAAAQLNEAKAVDVSNERACAPVEESCVPVAKPRIIGYPPLYSKLSEPPASTGGTNSDIEPRAQNGDNVSVDPLNSHISTTPPLPPAHAGGSDRIDPLDRQPGEALWPERFSAEKLGRTRIKLGTYSFSALYQQKPVPADGGLFKREWFKIIPRAPHGLRWRRATDPGLTSSAKADYTASFRVAFDNHNNFYIDGGFRKQLEYPDLRRYVLGRMLAEKDTLEHGIERSAHGRALEQDLAILPILRGKPLRGIDVKDGKVPRALPWIALAEQGKVFLTRGIWNRDFIDECLAFPLGTHDDQVDAVSLGFQMSRRKYGSLHRF